MIHVILGMHKSGTSLVSEMLHASGIYMGDFEEGTGYEQGNKWEMKRPKELNKLLMGDDKMYSLDLKKITNGNGFPAIEAQAVKLIDEMESTRGNWGFKDPRTCLTLRFWRTLFPDSTRYIIVRRDLDEVMLHYLQRNKKDRSKEEQKQLVLQVAETWLLYNRECLAWALTHPRQVLLLSYRDLFSDETEMLRLRDFCGREITDRRDKLLYRAKGPWPGLQELPGPLQERCRRFDFKWNHWHKVQREQWKRKIVSLKEKIPLSPESPPATESTFGKLFSMAMQMAAIKSLLLKKGDSLVVLAESEEYRNQGIDWLKGTVFKDSFEAHVVAFGERIVLPKKNGKRIAWLLGDASEVSPAFLKGLRKNGVSYVVTGATGNPSLWPLIWKLPRYPLPASVLRFLPGINLKKADMIQASVHGEKLVELGIDPQKFFLDNRLKKFSKGIESIPKLSKEIGITANGHIWPPLPSSLEDLAHSPATGHVLVAPDRVVLRLPRWNDSGAFQDLALIHQTTKWSSFAIQVVSSTEKIVELKSVLKRIPVFPEAYSGEKKRKTVMLVTSSLKAGGAERQWANLANLLASRGYHVALFLFESALGNGYYLPLVQNRPGISICSPRDMDSWTGQMNTARRQWFLSVAELLYPVRQKLLSSSFLSAMAAIGHFQPNLVYAQMDSPNVVAAMSAMCHPDLKVGLSFRNLPPHLVRGDKYAYYYDLYKNTLKRGCVYFSSNSMAGAKSYAKWLNFNSEQIRLLKNTLDPDLFAMDRPAIRLRKRAEMSVAHDKRVVLGVFRLVPHKRPDLFLETARQLCLERPDCHFWLAGAGEMQEECVRMASREGLQDRISVLGNRQDVWELMCAADVLLHTSEVEGTPNVLMEAQALRLPIVSSSVGGIPALVKHGQTGHLCESFAVSEFVRGLRLVLNDEKSAQDMAQLAFQHRRKDSSGQDWLEHIEDLMQPSTRHPKAVFL